MTEEQRKKKRKRRRLVSRALGALEDLRTRVEHHNAEHICRMIRHLERMFGTEKSTKFDLSEDA